MLLQQTLDKLEALGLFGMVLGLREQLESNQYLNLSFDERLGLLVDREAETRDSRRLVLRLRQPGCARKPPSKISTSARREVSIVPSS